MTEAKPQGPLSFTAAAVDFIEASEGEQKIPRFSMIAYTGGPMRIAGWRHPVVVDLAGMAIPSQSRPIRLQHDAMQGVGHTDSITAVNGQLAATGIISRATPAAQEVTASGKNGFPWQASIGASVEQFELVKEDQTAMANGRSFTGPFYLVSKSTLGEISFVDLGADGNTSATVAAKSAQHQQENDMNDESTTAVNGNADGNQEVKPQIQASQDIEAGIKASREKLAIEAERVASVQKICAGKHAEIEAKAIREGWDTNKTELEVLRAERPTAPSVHVSSSETSGNMIEAAACMAGRLNNIDKQYDEKTLEAASKRFRHGIGLQEMLLEAAWANGYSGRSFRSDSTGVLKAAFSNVSLSGIMSNIANKFLLEGANGIENTWREVCATRNVNDFKTVTSYRLTSGSEFVKVAPSGELKHGTLGEESFTNKADTYGLMLSVTRQDQINDDLGALTAVPRKLGRSAMLGLNTIFWTEFMNNASFFVAGNANYAEGANTALGIDSLTAAELLFLNQTDADGKPLAVNPAILLVPNALSTLATQLTSALEIRNTTATTKYATNNPHAGKFRPVRSSYLSNSTITGNSAAAWYLLADPQDTAVVEVAFLNGVQTPTIETAEADFSTLGIQMRGYFDFGVAKQDYRGGVKMKGTA